ncbi:MAG: antibiotic biosynthesis monooxygenase [Pirellulaceae bacterium]|nr:antibiotic biosynthesis monooxygenase [Pirellulaceae bacterium]
MIIVLATVEVAAGRRDEFLAEFRQVVPLVRAEVGCLEYGPAIDLPTNIAAQPAARPDVVVIVEKWESIETLEAHLIAPHMLAYRARVKPLVAGTTIQVLRPV